MKRWQAAVVAVAITASRSDPARENADSTSADSSGGGACPSARLLEDDTCCPTGHFADFASDACRAVGPSACRDLPLDKAADCVPEWADRYGPCPAGMWRPLPSSAECIPVGPGTQAVVAPTPKTGMVWACPWGFEPDPTTTTKEATGCRPASVECPQGKWATLPKAATVIYVDASAADGGNGTIDAPLRTLSDGVALAPTNAVVAIAPGTYADVVHVNRPLKIIGACPAKVALVPPKNLPVPAVHVIDGPQNGPVQVSGVSIQPTFAGVHTEDRDVVLSKVEIRGGSGPGVFVQTKAVQWFGASRVDMEDVVIQGIKPASAGALGVAVHGEGPVNAKRVLIDRVTQRGVWMVGPAARFVGNEVRMQRLSMTPKYTAPGLRAQDGGGVTCTGCAIQDVNGYGVYVFGPDTFASLHATRIDGVDTIGPPQIRAKGVGARLGASVVLRDVWISRVAGVGVVLDNGDTSVDAARLLVDDIRAHPWQTKYGIGIDIAKGARAKLSATRIANVRAGVGLYAENAGTHVQATDLVIDNMPSDKSLVGPHRGNSSGASTAIVVSSAARLDAERIRIKDVQGGGVVAQLGAQLLLNHAVIEGIRADFAGRGGTAIAVINESTAKLQAVRLDATRTAALFANTGATIDARALHIRSPRPRQSDGRGGAGIYVHGARLKLRGGFIYDARFAGIVAGDGSNSHLDVAGARIEGTRGRPALKGGRQIGIDGGFGVFVDKAAAPVRIHGSLLRDNEAIAVMIRRSSLHASDLVVTATRAGRIAAIDKNGRRQTLSKVSDGIALQNAPNVDISDTVVTGQERVGLLLDAVAGGKVTGFHIASSGIGIAEQNGSKVITSGNYLVGNTQNTAADRGLQLPLAPVPIKLDD